MQKIDDGCALSSFVIGGKGEGSLTTWPSSNGDRLWFSWSAAFVAQYGRPSNCYIIFWRYWLGEEGQLSQLTGICLSLGGHGASSRGSKMGADSLEAADSGRLMGLMLGIH